MAMQKLISKHTCIFKNMANIYSCHLLLKFHMKKFTRTNYGRFSIKYKGPMIWNTLPDVLKNIKSLQMFKKELKTFVLNQNIDY